MGKIKTKSLTKQIICIIIVLMLCNFIIPNATYAVEGEDDGGTIFSPFAKFITFLCDGVMQFLQDTFTSNESIEVGDGTYNFQYSPAIIFSGTVPALDVNFITPNEDTYSITNYDRFLEEKTETYIADVAEKKEYMETKDTYDAKMELAKTNEGYSQFEHVKTNANYTVAKVINSTMIYYEKDGKFCVEYFKHVLTGSAGGSAVDTYYYKYYDDAFDDESLESMSRTYSSIADELQPTISTWYNALRRIALVGLLSVLVYLGIMIVISSASGKENSKYKKMLTDWLVALCLLFTLHYIMNITLIVADRLSSIFNAGETDTLLNTIRQGIDESESWGEATTQVVMYVVLTMFTVIFSFQYLKRVLYMAFFTLIAPLVTLTYPLDKIKDGKAQAFTMWIREYVFNSLIQVVHLVIYYTLVGSAIDLVKLYPIYAIVAIGFMTQGERIIRKMFGFDNATTVGTMGAVAMGGLAATAMNKLKALPKSGKGESSEKATGNSNNKVRTAPNNLIETVKENKNVAVEGGAKRGNTVKTSTPVNTDIDAETKLKTASLNSNEEKPNILGGVKTLAGRYVLSSENIKKIGKATLGGLLGGTGAMIGFASGVAQGDLGKALTGIAAGGTAGVAVGKGIMNLNSNIGGNIKSTVNDVTDTWNEGAYGAEYAENVKMLRKFKQTSDYKELKKKFKDDLTNDKLSTMLNAGITNQRDMEKILEKWENEKK